MGLNHPEREVINRVVALGGGHGLAATLRALRLIATDITAVVTVADDGGSSGRIRRELPVLPPGDLRMAIAALAGTHDAHRVFAELLQHRFGGEGALAGHNVGNLLITGLTEVLGDDPLEALRLVGNVAGAVGRVLPMSPRPLEIAALVSGIDPAHPSDSRRIRGQVAVATTPGRVQSVQLLPVDPPACREACIAIGQADVVILGPGSWFTSVIPHLMVPDLRRAMEASPAKRLVALNLAQQPGETDNFSPAELLAALCSHAPSLRIDGVIADPEAILDLRELERECDAIGARLLVEPIASASSRFEHDPGRYADVIASAVEQVT